MDWIRRLRNALRLGAYAPLPLNQIVCGDCIEVMKTFPNESIDMTLTSPPYDQLRTYDDISKWNFDKFKAIANQLYRITKIGGVIVWIVGDATKNYSETGTSFKQALFFKEIGFKLYDTMIFHKHSPPLTHRRYEQHFEYMFVLSKGNPKTFNPIMVKKQWEDHRKTKSIRREKDGTYDVGYPSQKKTKIKGNVWKYNIGGRHVTKDKIAYEHPAIFPEKLAKDHIISWSNENDIILDPMVGSGTTCKIARQLNRRWIGIDINPEYCKIVCKRLNIQNYKNYEDFKQKEETFICVKKDNCEYKNEDGLCTSRLFTDCEFRKKEDENDD